MWPDERWAPSVGSFPTPVVPPTVDPDATPGITVSIACEWLPYIRGALQQLLLQATWKGDEATVALAQQRAFNLIDIFQECESNMYAFACPADFTFSDFGGTWYCLYEGSDLMCNWVPSLGYDYRDHSSGGGTAREVGLGRLVDATVSQVVITYNYRPGTTTPSSFVGMGIYWDGNHQYFSIADLSPGGTDIVKSFMLPSPVNVHEFHVWLTSDITGPGVSADGFCTIKRIELFGTSHNPSGISGCS